MLDIVWRLEVLKFYYINRTKFSDSNRIIKMSSVIIDYAVVRENGSLEVD